MVCTHEHTQEMVYGKGGEVYTRRAVVIVEYLQGLVEQINAISKSKRWDKPVLCTAGQH